MPPSDKLSNRRFQDKTRDLTHQNKAQHLTTHEDQKRTATGPTIRMSKFTSSHTYLKTWSEDSKYFINLRGQCQIWQEPSTNPVTYKSHTKRNQLN